MTKVSNEYIYSVDTGGTQSYDVTEQNDPSAPCTNGNTQNTNRVLLIPSLDTILGVVCFESCESCRVTIVSICDSTYSWNGINYNASGFYTDTLQTSLGQDSIVYLNLTVNFNTVSATIDTIGFDLVASGGLTYLWNTGADTSTITPLINGVYIVAVIDSCGNADTASFNVTYIPSTDISNNIESSVVLYPNPVNDILNISSSNIIKSYDVKDLLGRVIYSSSEINSNNISLNTSSFSNNIYLVSCIVNDQLIIKKIIVNR